MKQKIHLLLLLIPFFIACERLNLQTADSNVPIVESYIHPGQNVVVNVKKQFVFDSDDTETIYLNDLDLIIKNGENSYILSNTADGQYINEDLVLKGNQEYTLEFSFNNQLVSAITQTPDKPKDFALSSSSVEVVSFSNFTPGSGFPEQSDPVKITYSNPDNDYHITVIKCIESTLSLINSDTDRPMRSFRSLPIQGTEQMMNPREFTYYGTHRIILYRLNPEYAALYEQMETTSLDIEAPPSNVENGLGIFTGINSDTLYIEVVAD